METHAIAKMDTIIKTPLLFANHAIRFALNAPMNSLLHAVNANQLMEFQWFLHPPANALMGIILTPLQEHARNAKIYVSHVLILTHTA